jgi:uncharacterized protein YjdB
MGLRTSDSTIVSVNRSGQITAHRSGDAHVDANDGTRLLVRVRTISSLRIDPSSIHLKRGETASLHLVGDGKYLESAVATWSSTSPAIAMPQQPAGLIQANRPGEAVIAATFAGQRAECRVEVASETTNRNSQP